MRNRGIVFRYLTHPFRLITGNASVLILFGLVLLANYVSNAGEPIPLDKPGYWAFERLPAAINPWITSPWVAIIFLIAFLGKTVLTTWVAKEMLLIFQHSRKGIWGSFRKIQVGEVWWFILCQAATYLLFGAIALIFYVPSYFAWHKLGLDLAWLLLLAFGFLYPAFYIYLSTGSMMAVLPLLPLERVRKLKRLLFSRAFTSLYLFYLIRIGLEMTLLFLVPFLCLALGGSRALALISTVCGLAVPFALLRGSAYELKLRLLQEDQDIREIFANHYGDFESSRPEPAAITQSTSG